MLPEAVEAQKAEFQIQWGEFIVSGPNFMWSVDGHDKLSPYSIQIYTGIDAYSHFIVWIYVGISACTAISVGQQYLTAIEHCKKQPQSVQSDRGEETTLMTAAHHQLQTLYKSDISFNQCYLYGTSVLNQRIEAWWGQMRKGMMFKWQVSHVQLLLSEILTEMYRITSNHYCKKTCTISNLCQIRLPYMLFICPRFIQM